MSPLCFQKNKKNLPTRLKASLTREECMHASNKSHTLHLTATATTNPPIQRLLLSRPSFYLAPGKLNPNPGTAGGVATATGSGRTTC
jgi:hypothetical protein